MDDVQAQQTNTDHPAVVLQQIRDNTDMLIKGLRNPSKEHRSCGNKNRFLMENTAAKSGSREKKKNVL